MGVNETGASENACWLEGKIFYLPPVMFAREDSNIRSSQPDSLEPSIENVEKIGLRLRKL